jgi:predicted RecB family nuclease
MQIVDGRPVYSATDLVGHLACEYLTELERARMAGLVAAPHIREREVEVLQKRGLEHERRYLNALRAQSRVILEIERDEAISDYGGRLRQQAQATRDAMAAGADVIYQATFFDETWVGYADFLLRCDGKCSVFGNYHYEVADTKLARHVRASALLQICSYVDHLERIQGVRPERMHVVLGGNPQRTESFRVNDYLAYYRMARRRFEEAVGATAAAAVYPPAAIPEPVEHCDVCRWTVDCQNRRRAADHLSLVAGISSSQRRELSDRGVDTLAELAVLPVPIDPKPKRTSVVALERVREQARIQLESRQQGNKTLHEMLPLDETNPAGLASLPPPSPGDLFLDLEGDPFALDIGLDYLFGVLEPAVPEEDGQPTYHAFWSRDDHDLFSFEGERAAFERTIDLIMDRWRDDPNLHVYHYAPYEPSAFKRLMGRYGTREDEVDRLLRGEIFVDLYRVVRQGVRASVESYSIKKLEPLYELTREVELRDAGSSIAEFEEFLQLSEREQPAAEHLEKIRLYNRDDVLSTWKLRDWLEERRSELIAHGREVPRPTPGDPEPAEELGEQLKLVEALTARLSDGVPLDPKERDEQQHARWLLGQLLSWHRREDKSTWWQYYHLMELTEEERIEARESLGGLEFLDVVGEVKQSLVYRYRFPEQDHSIKVGTTPRDPNTDKAAGTVVEINEAERTIDLQRSKRSTAPHPTSLIPLEHVDSKPIQQSLFRLGSWVAEHGIDAEGPYRAARDLLLRKPPRTRSAASQECGPLQKPGEEIVDAACRIGRALFDSVLPIQGPPGAGKTYTGGRMIASLLEAGQKVGITSNSHKAIENLLESACKAATERGLEIRAVQRAGEGAGLSHPAVTQAPMPDDVEMALRAGNVNLVAGTPWLWSRPGMQASVDVLFIDEAGQMSLANSVAVAPATRSLVLLGDPQQLDQPLKGVHPPGAAASALGHLLAEHDTLPADRGIFLGTTWRLHPNVCRFTSEAFYDSKLLARYELQNQVISSDPLDGSGLWIWPVVHSGNATESEEEARTVAEIARDLVEGPGTWIDKNGVTLKLGWNDVLIVAPYNAQVGMIQRMLPPEARVGTVDKFQGQEAPVSIYSMASSTPEDAPRGMDFLYSRNRLNVASSRARCATILVCSPALLHVYARTPQQMRLANALCQFVEMARRPE